MNGVVWGAIERFFSKGLNFVFNLVIARLLFPEDYGIVQIVTVICSLCEILIDSGFNSALIQKKDRTDTDFSTVFYFNLGISAFFYLALFIVAPWLAAAFGKPILKNLIRVIALLLIFNAIGFTQSTKLAIELKFKEVSLINLFASLISGAMAILMAYYEYGVWALAVQALLAVVIRNVLFIWRVRWKPSPTFSLESLRGLFSYGVKLLLATGVGNVYSAIVSFAIGKKISMSDLGLYGRADSLVATPTNIVFDPIKGVTFPVFSKIQDDRERLLSYYQQTLKLTAFLAFPVLLGIFAIADPLVRVLLTDKWAGAIPLLRITCFIYFFQPLVPVCQNYLLALGHSRSFLNVQLISKGIGLVLILSSLSFGVIWVCWAQVVTWSLFAVLYAHKVKAFSGYGLGKIALDILPSVLLSIAMAGLVTLVMLPVENIFVKLALGVVAGVASYTILAHILKFKELKIGVELAKSYFKR